AGERAHRQRAPAALGVAASELRAWREAVPGAAQTTSGPREEDAHLGVLGQREAEAGPERRAGLGRDRGGVLGDTEAGVAEAEVRELGCGSGRCSGDGYLPACKRLVSDRVGTGHRE